MSAPALFLPQPGDDGRPRLLPSAFARSVWSLELVHGAATAALLARTVEGAVREDLRIVRLTVDLMRPVPLVPLDARAIVVREARRIQVVEAGLFVQRDGEELEVGRATALAMWRSPLSTEGVLAVDAASPPAPESLPTLGQTQTPGEAAYHSSIEWRPTTPWPTDERPALWIRNPTEIVPGEPLSPVARAVATADALSPLANFAPSFRDESVGIINADISLYLHRQPSDEWLCVVATSRHGDHGVAVSDGALYDRSGPVGRIALASLAQSERPLGVNEGGPTEP